MIKKICACVLLGMLSACILQQPEQYCPLISMKREDARLIQKVNYQDDFEVELKAVEGFCFYDERVKQEKAHLTPIFIIRKLRNTDETDIHFSWFTNTVKGPPAYLGKKTYHTGTSMKTGERSKEFRGDSVELKIPQEMMYEFEIMTGLVVSPQEKKYNKKIFDVDFEFYDDSNAAEGEYVPLAQQNQSGCSSCGM